VSFLQLAPLSLANTDQNAANKHPGGAARHQNPAGDANWTVPTRLPKCAWLECAWRRGADQPSTGTLELLPQTKTGVPVTGAVDDGTVLITCFARD